MCWPADVHLSSLGIRLIPASLDRPFLYRGCSLALLLLLLNVALSVEQVLGSPSFSFPEAPLEEKYCFREGEPIQGGLWLSRKYICYTYMHWKVHG